MLYVLCIKINIMPKIPRQQGKNLTDNMTANNETNENNDNK